MKVKVTEDYNDSVLKKLVVKDTEFIVKDTESEVKDKELEVSADRAKVLIDAKVAIEIKEAAPTTAKSGKGRKKADE